MTNTNLETTIEALLFFKGEAVSKKELAKLLSVSEAEIAEALARLSEQLQNRGVRLIQKDATVLLATAPEAGELIEKMQKEELSKDLGKAGLETLAIVLYKGPITRSEIDYIRGVNSTFILRNLMIRGLIERETDPHTGRSFLYKPTLELFSFLGISTITDLPEFDTVKDELEHFMTQEDQTSNTDE